MRRPGRVTLGVALVLVLSACAGGQRGPTGPVVSPTGIVYEPGIPPTRTRFSQTATLLLSRGIVDRALEVAQDGLDSDPANPIHYFLVGVALSRLGEYEEADRMLAQAQRIYPAYELYVEPERRAAWGEAFNRGVQAYDSGNVEVAINAWGKAITMYDLRSEAHRNLASLLAREGVYEEAITTYELALVGLEKLPATFLLDEAALQARAEEKMSTEESLAQVLLFVKRFAEAEPLLRAQILRDSTNVQIRSDLAAALTGQARMEEAAEIYALLLSEADLGSTELFNLGIALFRAEDFDRAGKAFERLTQLRPDSRDAWFNYVNALFAAEDWDSLTRAGDRLIELDPLGKNVGLIAARAHLEAGDQQAALQGLERVDSAVVHVEELQMRPFGSATRIQAQVVGNKAEAGMPVRLRFAFYYETEPLGSETLVVSAPPSGESETFEVLFRTGATAYRYEIVP
jgi:tetratricopeptide (TPR) repeat protein